MNTNALVRTDYVRSRYKLNTLIADQNVNSPFVNVAISSGEFYVTSNKGNTLPLVELLDESAYLQGYRTMSETDLIYSCLSDSVLRKAKIFTIDGRTVPFPVSKKGKCLCFDTYGTTQSVLLSGYGLTGYIVYDCAKFVDEMRKLISCKFALPLNIVDGLSDSNVIRTPYYSHDILFAFAESIPNYPYGFLYFSIGNIRGYEVILVSKDSIT